MLAQQWTPAALLGPAEAAGASAATAMHAVCAIAAFGPLWCELYALLAHAGRPVVCPGGALCEGMHMVELWRLLVLKAVACDTGNNVILVPPGIEHMWRLCVSLNAHYDNLCHQLLPALATTGQTLRYTYLEPRALREADRSARYAHTCALYLELFKQAPCPTCWAMMPGMPSPAASLSSRPAPPAVPVFPSDRFTVILRCVDAAKPDMYFRVNPKSTWGKIADAYMGVTGVHVAEMQFCGQVVNNTLKVGDYAYPPADEHVVHVSSVPL